MKINDELFLDVCDNKDNALLAVLTYKKTGCEPVCIELNSMELIKFSVWANRFIKESLLGIGEFVAELKAKENEQSN